MKTHEERDSVPRALDPLRKTLPWPWLWNGVVGLLMAMGNLRSVWALAPDITRKSGAQASFVNGVAILPEEIFHVRNKSITASGGYFVACTGLIAALLCPVEAFEISMSDLKARARKGAVEAQFELGRRFEFGIGVRPNARKAVAWYRCAAEQHLPRAQHSLGRTYAEGSGVAQDYTLARNWYEKAAAQGYALAQNKLGLLYREGRGVRQDWVEAYKWFALAAGPEGRIFAVSNRDALAQRLTAEQVSEGQLRASSALAANSHALWSGE